MKTRTEAYVMTADVNSVGDMAQIEIVRKTVATSNKIARTAHKHACRYAMFKGEPEPKAPMLYRVSLKARLGKNNPAYEAKYKQQWIKAIKLEDAARIDVYVHEMR